MTPKERITDTELNAYLDGELSSKERASVESRLADDPHTARKAAEMGRIDEAIRARYAPVLDEPVPESMRLMLTEAARPERRAGWLRAAAAVLLLLAGGGAGYLIRGFLEPSDARTAELVNTALQAHSVYTPEVRHPVEVGGGEEAHLVKWLTKRIGADVRAPVLTAQGYRLLGGRLLPHSGGPAAQFMYENPQGRRLTLYVRKTGATENTAFQFASAKGISAFYWIDKPLAYALVGELPHDELQVIARVTYEQLN